LSNQAVENQTINTSKITFSWYLIIWLLVIELLDNPLPEGRGKSWIYATTAQYQP
jgi:hypothetical protein